jgi:hypothetical protein
MADASNFVHIQEASFWFGLFVLDRGLAEVLPAKIARGWIHIGVGALAFFYGVGWLSGLTFRLGVVIAAAVVLLVIVVLRSRRTVGTVPPAAPVTSDWIAWIAKGSLAGVTAFLLIWLLVVAYDRVRSTGYGLSNLPSPSATNSPTPSWICPRHPPVDKQFAEMYARHASELGCSEGETQSPDDVYEAYYQHAIILWISNPLGSFIQLPAVSNRTIKFYPDPAWGLPMSDTKLRQQSAFSQFPKHCALPFGGVATHWLDDPKDWSWIGCREWHCYLKSVRYQQFEHGIIVGLLPRSYKSEGEPRRGQIFTIVRNGLWSSEDLEVTKYPPSASACTEPLNAPNPK